MINLAYNYSYHYWSVYNCKRC